VELFTPNGTFIDSELEPTTAVNNLSVLEDVELDKSNRLFITDPGEHAIKIYSRVN